MKKLFVILGLGLVMMLPLGASARPRVFVGGGFYSGFGYGFGPGFYSPYYGYGYGYGPYYNAYPNTGEVKIDTKVGNAQVFINGAFAGNTHELKTMHLHQGNYKLEIQEQGVTKFSEQIFVANGKTLKLHPAL